MLAHFSFAIRGGVEALGSKPLELQKRWFGSPWSQKKNRILFSFECRVLFHWPSFPQSYHKSVPFLKVLDVVRSNYDTLTLKLQESLDQYERYSEKPSHPAFFTNLVRGIIQDVKKNSLSTKSLNTHLSKRSSLLDNTAVTNASWYENRSVAKTIANDVQDICFTNAKLTKSKQQILGL